MYQYRTNSHKVKGTLLGAKIAAGLLVLSGYGLLTQRLLNTIVSHLLFHFLFLIVQEFASLVAENRRKKSLTRVHSVGKSFV